MVAQKVVKKSIVNTHISFIQIDASNCFEIEIMTADSKEMIIEATIEGEYEKELLLKVHETGSTLLINAGFQPNFEHPNDKLSAHKVISIALKIQLPRHKNVTVFGMSCNIIISGAYNKLKTILNDGNCYLNNVVATAEVKTQSGNIIVKTKAASIIATSKYGCIDKGVIPIGDNQYTLNTITGNIVLNRIE